MRSPNSGITYSHRTDSSTPAKRMTMDANKNILWDEDRKQGGLDVVVIIPREKWCDHQKIQIRSAKSELFHISKPVSPPGWWLKGDILYFLCLKKQHEKTKPSQSLMHGNFSVPQGSDVSKRLLKTHKWVTLLLQLTCSFIKMNGDCSLF